MLSVAAGSQGPTPSGYSHESRRVLLAEFNGYLTITELVVSHRSRKGTTSRSRMLTCLRCGFPATCTRSDLALHFPS